MPTPPGYTEPLPNTFGFNYGGWDEGHPVAKPLVELEMTRVSAEIRRKPSWWIKFRDPEILAKWREEALAQAERIKESHVDYVLKELDGYANLRDEESGAEVSCHDRIWQSDQLIPASLKERLIAGVSKLKNVLEEEKDRHSQSNGQVLDLVDPSLYPIVYGRTLSYPEDSEDRDPAKLQTHLEAPTEWLNWTVRSPERAYYVSERFQWLPTDFRVSDDGKSVKSDGYINNINPVEHADLHMTVEDLIAVFIPLFERVLTDSIPDNKVVPERTDNTYHYDLDNYPNEPNDYDFPDSELYHIKHDDWERSRPIILPGVVEDGYKLGSLEARGVHYLLGGKTIQVIVKLANIHLTPGEPIYDGGSWRIEGMKNEQITASGIYYYDEENITESRLAFRVAVSRPGSYDEYNVHGCTQTWGIGNDDPMANDLGSVLTCQDRCIAFPNAYQHRVSPFELADKSKPGHCKIVALFLVDPAVHIPSTKTVPPQQKDWHIAGIRSNPTLNAWFAPEIINHIASLSGDTMTREEAEKHQQELMDERTVFVAQNNEKWFNAPYRDTDYYTESEE